MLDVNDVVNKRLQAEDQRNLERIKKQWGSYKTRLGVIQCRGCHYSDIHVVTVTKETRYRTYQNNELSIYCKLHHWIVKKPFNKCPDRLEKQTKPISQW